MFESEEVAPSEDDNDEPSDGEVLDDESCDESD